MLIRAQCGTVPYLISQVREERVDIFCLVVRPDGCIVGFAAGTVHQSAFRVVNTFRSTDFCKSEHGVDDRIGRIQDQVIPKAGNQILPGLQFPVNIERKLAFILFISGKNRTESQLLARLQLAGCLSVDCRNQLIAAIHPLCGICLDNRTGRRNFHRYRRFAYIA